MQPDVERRLAHVLLVELLAHQFCFPVRWIETQDVLLAQRKTERVIELGPADTLLNLARQTLARKYQSHDVAHALSRRLLCCERDASEIYHADAARPEEESPSKLGRKEAGPGSHGPPPAATTPAPPVAAAVPVAPAAPVVSAAPTTVALSMPAGPAVSITVAEITQAIVAYALKKSMTEISLGSTIRALAGGRSTLQNEIVGDLGKEFGSLPEAPEDMALDDLCTSLQAAFAGQLGKHSTSLVGRMVSSKMPGGFNTGALRKYLESRWGLTSGRQDAVLLLAVVQQPPARISAEGEAKAFMDTVVQAYVAQTGLVLSAPTSDGATGAATGVALDPEALDRLRKDQRVFNRQMLEVYARELRFDLHAADRHIISSKRQTDDLQAELDLWSVEHGDVYLAGIKPKFDPLKVRVYDSYWNWAMQDLLTIVYGILNGTVNVTGPEMAGQRTRLTNRSSPRLLEAMRYLAKRLAVDQRERSSAVTARHFLEQLTQDCEQSLTKAPVAQDVSPLTAPRTIIDPLGNISYVEAPRRAALLLNSTTDKKPAPPTASPPCLCDDIRQGTTAELVCQRRLALEHAALPRLRSKGSEGWNDHESSSDVYRNVLDRASSQGMTFKDKVVLVTGAGRGSIAARIVEGLLNGGAKVVVTTSSYSSEATRHHQEIYAQHGGRDSRLILVPFNQGSRQDVEALVAYIYDSANGLGWDLDHIVPFAAISENGREIDNIDSKSELAHRLMLTNTVRLLGAVKKEKARRRIRTRPAQVILPLSPNHGAFGNDGLYPESKLALEALFDKWHSEGWSDYLSICGALIGWTRGTGLMAGNDLIADGVERESVRTFSRQEMAFHILGLMTAPVRELCQAEPLLADLSGGMASIPNLKDLTTSLRERMTETSEIRRALVAERAMDRAIVQGTDGDQTSKRHTLERRANLQFDFPRMPDYATEIEPLGEQLKDMIDLDTVVVVVGFAEVGPWGNARTRWEMEAYGEFSLAGCIEMAWIMGLIRNHDGPIQGKRYCGWVDARTKEPVADKDVKSKYEAHILEHSGIRLLEARPLDGPDPLAKRQLHEVIVQEDLAPFEASKEMALDFKREHGDLVDIFEHGESGECTVHLKKGASLMVPKATKYDHAVAGQLPTGWDARTYGIPEDIISQVDPVVLYSLVCTVEAFLSAGITDTYELYQHLHVSEIGICIGSGLGGMASLQKMFKQRFLDKQVQKDVLSEAFTNTTAAWINMLLLSSSGPIVTPVGACATAVESLDIGCGLITSGKAKMCLVGGFDDLAKDVSAEFANMKATNNAEEDLRRGRDPKQMSRPATSTRSGFVESEGCGVQVITTARLALDMGLPIHGVVALTHAASDQTGRSVPAPGKGLVTIAREDQASPASPLLDMRYRRRNIDLRRQQIQAMRESELAYLQAELESMRTVREPASSVDASEYGQQRQREIEREAVRQQKEAWNTYGNQFWKNDDRISPLRGALATWGLTVNDLDVASFHGTSTRLNERNEMEVVHRQLAHLGRTRGNTLLGVCQKYLTGHPKGAAGAWMMNGGLQMLNSGLVPGHRNADNIDSDLAQFDYVAFPSRSIQTDGIRAFTLTSFGFGQKGAQVIGVHARYLFAALDPAAYRAYQTKVQARQRRAYRQFHHGLVHNRVVVAKDQPPYPADQALAFLMDPKARAAPAAAKLG
ncbi:MAG: 3-oxoacyl-[acyl-carrier-protein] synthase [Phylliscum demangeonii]|nr:MAG: 3-oxoacyl-[acyl-carrier-protein] synthase [Phylliscum demangeonii]